MLASHRNSKFQFPAYLLVLSLSSLVVDVSSSLVQKVQHRRPKPSNETFIAQIMCHGGVHTLSCGAF